MEKTIVLSHDVGTPPAVCIDDYQLDVHQQRQPVPRCRDQQRGGTPYHPRLREPKADNANQDVSA